MSHHFAIVLKMAGNLDVRLPWNESSKIDEERLGRGSGLWVREGENEDEDKEPRTNKRGNGAECRPCEKREGRVERRPERVKAASEREVGHCYSHLCSLRAIAPSQLPRILRNKSCQRDRCHWPQSKLRSKQQQQNTQNEDIMMPMVPVNEV